MIQRNDLNNGRTSLEANIERYDRQLRAAGWGIEEQRKIYNSNILLIGSDILAEMTLGCLAGLGTGNILVMDNEPNRSNNKSFLINNLKKGSKVEGLANEAQKINLQLKIKSSNSRFSEGFLDYKNFRPDIIIDTTNDLSLKERALEYSIKNNVEFISSYCNHKKSIVSVYNPGRKNIDEILDSEKIIEEDPEQGGITAGINAGIITDELRKSLFRLNDRDCKLNKRVFYNLDCSKRTSLLSDIDKRVGDLSDVKALVVGAGAIGNYVALNLALAGFRNVDIIDYDSIEDTNLNRQILFYGKVGEEKAKVLSEKIKEIGKVKSRAFVFRIGEDSEKFFMKNGYDIIFGCLDNFEARYYLNNFAVDFKTPYIDGATTDLSGNLAVYHPKKTVCIKCKKNLRPVKIQRSCGDALPSVVIPNIIIGSAMVGEAVNLLRGEILEERFVYDSFTQNRFYLQREPGAKSGCKCLN